MRVRGLVAALLVTALCACGGRSGEPEEQSTSTPSPSRSTEAAGPDVPGKPANDDLSGFTCSRDGAGDWHASGVLTSPSGSSDYRVTVVVAPTGSDRAGSDRARARRKFIQNVKQAEPKNFEVKKVPAGSEGGTCRVQVVRLD